METESTSVYMCFPCYQEFNTLEEVIAHQMTCTAEAGAPPAIAAGTVPVSLPFLQTQVYTTQSVVSSSAVLQLPQVPQAETPHTQAASAPAGGTSILVTGRPAPRKPPPAAAPDQPRILYQCGDCDALFDSLLHWQRHRKEEHCRQDNKTGAAPEPGPDSGPVGNGSGLEPGPGGAEEEEEEEEEGQAEIEVALEPEESNGEGGGVKEESEGGGGGGGGGGTPDGGKVDGGGVAENEQEVGVPGQEEGVPSGEDATVPSGGAGVPAPPPESQAPQEDNDVIHPPPVLLQDPPAPDPDDDDPAPRRRRGASEAKKAKPPSSLLCVDCGACFALVSELVSHRKTKHGLQEALHRCTVCGESFLNTTLFLYHRKQHRQRGEERVANPAAEGETREDTPADDGTALVQEEEEVVEESIMEMEGVSGPQTGTGTGGQDGSSASSASEPASFLCAACGRGFGSERLLGDHREKQHGLKGALHLCAQCGASFMSTTQYLYHRRQHRAGGGGGGGGGGSTPPPQGSPEASAKRVLLSPPGDVVGVAPPQAKRSRPAIRILSMNALKERNIVKEEKLPDRPVTEPPDSSSSSDITNRPPPAKLLQDWSRTPLPHVCPHCGQTFTRRVFLRAHVFSHTGEKLFTCKVCNKSFASSPNLLRHSLTHMGTKPFPCAVCGKRFSQAGTLKRHALTHTQQPGAARPPRRRRSRWQKGAEGEGGAFQLFSCPHCTARFQTEEQLQDHRLLHTSHPFPCAECGLAFKRRKELDLHSLSHQDKEPASCPRCSAQFVNQSVLEIHLERCPESEEERSQAPGRGRGQGRGRSTGQLECDLCGHRCMTQEGLDLHRLSHTGQTPLKCPLSPCRRRFASSGALGEHVLAHCQGALSKGRAARRFHCQVCGKDFAYASTFNVHMRIHTDERPFECSTCGKRFRQLPHLQDHERIHSGLRPFCCWVCGKSFSVAARLTEHARIHSGEKPYPCPLCAASFRSRSNYDKHMRTHGVYPGGGVAGGDAEMAAGAQVLTTLAAGGGGGGMGGEGEGAVQTILLVQSSEEGGGGMEQVVIPGLSGVQQVSSQGGVFLHHHPSLAAGQTISVAGQTISVAGQTISVAGQTISVAGQTISVAGQTISVPSLAGLTVDGQEMMPSVIVVEGQDLPHTFEFIVEESV